MELLMLHAFVVNGEVVHVDVDEDGRLHATIGDRTIVAHPDRDEAFVRIRGALAELAGRPVSIVDLTRKWSVKFDPNDGPPHVEPRPGMIPVWQRAFGEWTLLGWAADHDPVHDPGPPLP